MNMEPYASRQALGVVVTMSDGSWFGVFKTNDNEQEAWPWGQES